VTLNRCAVPHQLHQALARETACALPDSTTSRFHEHWVDVARRAAF
jgi:hypothetical protein